MTYLYPRAGGSLANGAVTRIWHPRWASTGACTPTRRPPRRPRPPCRPAAQGISAATRLCPSSTPGGRLWAYYNGRWWQVVGNQLIGQDGAGVIAQGAGNILGNSSSGVVSQGAGNIANQNNAGLRGR